MAQEVEMDGLGLAALVGMSALVAWEHRAAFVLGEPPPRPRPRATKACRCPYCHEELVGSGLTRRCARCGTLQHGACWEQHGGCSVHGCSGRSGRARLDPVEAGTEAEAEPPEVAEPATPIPVGPGAA